MVVLHVGGGSLSQHGNKKGQEKGNMRKQRGAQAETKGEECRDEE